MQNVRIQTTQNVFIEYEPASLGDRIVATLLDWLIYLSYYLLMDYILDRLGLEWESVVGVAALAPFVFYHLLCEIFLDGQSVGKKLRKIKVAKMDGTQPSVGSYLLRWMLRPVDMFPVFGGVALIVVASNGKGQRLGDLAAGTTVVNLQRRVSLSETALPTLDEKYVPLFPQVTQLADKDIALIREAMSVHMRNLSGDGDRLLEVMARKVQAILGVQTDLSPWIFLNTVVKDYTHLTGKI